MTAQGAPPEEQAAAIRSSVALLREQVSRVIVGQREVMELLVVAVLADGHVLLEGLPGLGKTLMVKTLARCLSLEFNRIQFTPDLMPADITGTTVITRDREGGRSFTFEPGPLFTNLLLADEINRAGPKTQSALLQAMQEREVSLFGKHYPLNDPFLVFATQNPIELAGTYPLPEAQLDRFFFKINIAQPPEEDLVTIAQRTTGAEPPSVASVVERSQLHDFRQMVRQIPVAGAVMQATARALMALRPEGEASPPLVRRYLRYGVSPRGLQSLILAAKARACLDGRFNVGMEDVQHFWLPALRHRLILDMSASLEGVTADTLLREVAPGPLAS